MGGVRSALGSYDIEEAAGPTGARLPDNVMRAAIEHGELLEQADPFAYDEVASAALLVRKLNGLTTDASYRVGGQRAAASPAQLESGAPARHLLRLANASMTINQTETSEL